MKSIEIARVHWFGVITQYKAIFGDDSTGKLAIEEFREDTGILADWFRRRLLEFLALLGEAVSHMTDCGALGSVYECAMHFGASLARVGADFRLTLCPIFETRMVTLLKEEYLDEAHATLIDAIYNDEWNKAPKAVGTVSGTQNGSATSAGLAPDRKVLRHPILAMFLNQIIAAFNEARQFALASAAVPLAAAFEDLMVDIARALGDRRAAIDADDASSTARFRAFCDLFDECVVDFSAALFKTQFKIPLKLAEAKALISHNSENNNNTS